MCGNDISLNCRVVAIGLLMFYVYVNTKRNTENVDDRNAFPQSVHRISMTTISVVKLEDN